MPIGSRRTISRYPSCLISWIQPGPLGGRSAEDGRQGSMKPEGGRRVRDNMGYKYQRARTSRVGLVREPRGRWGSRSKTWSHGRTRPWCDWTPSRARSRLRHTNRCGALRHRCSRAYVTATTCTSALARPHRWPSDGASAVGVGPRCSVTPVRRVLGKPRRRGEEGKGATAN